MRIPRGVAVLPVACALMAFIDRAMFPAIVDWPINGGPNNARYSPLTQITWENVGRLQVAWSYDSHDAFKGSEMQSNPIVVDGVLYATTPTLRMVAVIAEMGSGLWTLHPA